MIKMPPRFYKKKNRPPVCRKNSGNRPLVKSKATFPEFLRKRGPSSRLEEPKKSILADL